MKIIAAADVAKHSSAESCWVVLYGHVYDVTDFVAQHPGGSKVILQLAGQDATSEFDPIHPPGTLESNLTPEMKLGKVDDVSKLRRKKKKASGSPPPPDKEDAPVRLAQLLNLDEIEHEATKRISRKAWSYYYSAGDDLISKRLNNLAYRQVFLRPRVFVDCSTADPSTSLLGGTLAVGIPVYVSPAAMARLAHPDGERGIARAAARFGALQLVSNNASMTPEQVAEGGASLGWQLYVQKKRSRSEAMLRRINAMKDRYKLICLTLDAPHPGKREHDERAQFEDDKFTVEAAVKGGEEKRPGGGGFGQQLFWGTASDLTWRETLAWLARHTDLPIVLKGLQTHEDAFIAAQFAPQVRAIILSNHGGRALDTSPPAVHTLLEIRKYCPDVFEKVDVWVDGGVRRGTDVVKALCLGAKAVGIGRAALFGLGAGGQAGVERVFEILKAEIETCMILLGVKTIAELGPRFVSLVDQPYPGWARNMFLAADQVLKLNTRMVERDIYDGDAGLKMPNLWASSKL